MAFINEKNKVIITIENIDTYRGIKEGLFELMQQVGLMYNGKPDIEMEGKVLFFYAELLRALEIDPENKGVYEELKDVNK